MIVVHDQANINTEKMDDRQLMITKKVAFNYMIHQLTTILISNGTINIDIKIFDISKIRI